MDETQTYKIEIRGIVQGVGFRPFLHMLVSAYGLCGRARNTSDGVELLLTGDRERVDVFLSALKENPPQLAHIDSIAVTPADVPPFTDFRIEQSQAFAHKHALIAPDVGMCADCLRELLDPADRRYRYPFINCTNCGPRFTIIKDVPYDRCNTTMAAFPMCASCAGEYRDIQNRRYHAQPDCCPVCGPHAFFLDADGASVTGDAVETARAFVKAGRIIAVKGLGGIHLACDAHDEAAVRTLRARKQRDERPFALMCRDIAAASALCKMTEEEKERLASPARPIVLLEKRVASRMPYVSENDRLGVMLPYTPLHVLLMGTDIDALVMTSANLSDQPILYKNEDALRELAGIADGFLLHDREIHVCCDDSLYAIFDGKPYPVRRSRGYAPAPETLPMPADGILACGAEQKASFALSRGKDAFLSQHIGDLKNYETLEHYTRQIAHFEKLFDITPQALACDMHPDYLSTAYAAARARETGLPLYPVQHHHAHMAACMAENGLEKPCIGVVWDGTGYGADGTVWGGEFLVGDYVGFVRAGSLRPIPLMGGDKAVKEIYRVGAALLKDAEESVPACCDAEKYAAIQRLLQARVNCPRSSGMGRLFDGVYALLTGRESVSYEGQAAVLLETMAKEADTAYPIRLAIENGLRLFDTRPMLSALCEEQRAGADAGQIAGRFIKTLADMAVDMCLAIRADMGVSSVVLSGGVFLNQKLLPQVIAGLARAGFTVYHHQRVSTNDEGIAFGQTAIAAAQRTRREEEGKRQQDVLGDTAETDIR
ncbi:MAG: carbamoyltransferase HypF [Eubacteriales bacterium]|nr:carbamoyltransferase HypF [Eubacteriales bacterium]